jgi:cardiolipin synthase
MAGDDARSINRSKGWLRGRWQDGTIGRWLRHEGQWALIAAVLFLALIGFLHLTRGTTIRHVRGISADGAPIAATDPQFPLNVGLLTGGWLLSSHHVEIALNGDGTYERLFADLQSARGSITLQVYYGMIGKVSDRLGRILLERAKAGVLVFVLYDAFGAQKIPEDQVEILRAGGVNIQPFRPLRLSTLHLIQNRSHVRGIVIDGRIGWTGGFGVDDKWLGDGRTNGAWRETNVRFEGPAVRQLQAVFAASWAEATGDLFTGRIDLVPATDGTVSAGVLYASPTLGTTPAERFFALSIAAARKSIYISNAYFAPEDSFITLLSDAARRGVDVRILTAGEATDVKMVLLAGRARYERLLQAGVKIYEWQPTTMHAKTFVIDGIWSTIGSMNFDNRSLALNEEATLMMLDPAIGEQMQKIFLDDTRFCEEIGLDRFRQRSAYQRIKERAAHMMMRVL